MRTLGCSVFWPFLTLGQQNEIWPKIECQIFQFWQKFQFFDENFDRKLEIKNAARMAQNRDPKVSLLHWIELKINNQNLRRITDSRARWYFRTCRQKLFRRPASFPSQMTLLDDILDFYLLTVAKSNIHILELFDKWWRNLKIILLFLNIF